jgi:hypothetical protein
MHDRCTREERRATFGASLPISERPFLDRRYVNRAPARARVRMHVNRIARARRSSGNIDFRVPGRVTDVAIRIGRRGGMSDVTVGQSSRGASCERA